MGEKELRADEDKIAAVTKLLPPANVKELMSFLGFVGFYRRLIPRFAQHGAKLTPLLKKGAMWEWGQD